MCFTFTPVLTGPFDAVVSSAALIGGNFHESGSVQRTTMDLMHVEPVFTGSVWAFIALTRALVLACLPLAAIGLALFALTKRRGIKWASWWFRLFQVGFVIQICSVVLTIVLALILHLFSPYELSGTIWESLLPLIFVGSAVGGSFALAAWRGLMRAVRLEAPPSLVR